MLKLQTEKLSISLLKSFVIFPFLFELEISNEDVIWVAFSIKLPVFRMRSNMIIYLEKYLSI